MTHIVTLYLETTEAMLTPRKAEDASENADNEHKRRAKRHVDVVRCDFSSRSFAFDLFDFCLNLTKTKIAYNLINPVPQIGPLVMDVIRQRRTVVEKV
jgi:hypothetical protein